MRCPKCGAEVRPSKKHPGYYLCDTCKKRYPASSVIDDEEEYEDYDPHDEEENVDNISSYDFYDAPKNVKSGPKPRPPRSSKKSHGKKRKKKKGGPLKVILIIILILVIVAAAGYVLGKNKDKKSSKSQSTKTETSQRDKKDSKKDTYSVGETAEHNDIQVQILGYEESKGNEWAVPGDGNIFVFVNMQITNNSDKELTVSSMMSFNNYCGDTKLDYSTNAFTALSTDPGKQQLDGSIATGKNLNGYLCLEVPADWTTIEIHYTDNVWSDNKVKFEINK